MAASSWDEVAEMIKGEFDVLDEQRQKPYDA